MSRLYLSLEPNGSGLRRIEVITGAGGRRRWSEGEKALAVEGSRWLLTRSSRRSRVDMALRHSNCSPGEGRRAGGQRRRVAIFFIIPLRSFLMRQLNYAEKGGSHSIILR
jgi:hypothetical protein